MPNIYVNPDDSLLLAYEATERKNGNNIALRYYESILHLRNGTYSGQHLIDRTLSPGCEGTPSFESVQINGGLEDSEIKLRFHFLWDMKKDQLGRGILTNWSKWES